MIVGRCYNTNLFCFDEHVEIFHCTGTICKKKKKTGNSLIKIGYNLLRMFQLDISNQNTSVNSDDCSDIGFTM